MTSILTPEYSLTYRLLIKIESIDNFSPKPYFSGSFCDSYLCWLESNMAAYIYYTGRSRLSNHPSSLRMLHIGCDLQRKKATVQVAYHLKMINVLGPFGT